MSLQGKVALVTGAGQGIGKGIALAFARQGCAVAVCDMNPEAVRQTAAEIERAGGKAVFQTFDVTSPGDARAAIDETLRTFARLDILSNVAGISPKRDGQKIPFYEIPPEEWDRVMAVNLSSCLHLSAGAAPYMIRQRSGRIINMASIAGKAGWAGASGAHYLASKAGVIGLTRAMAHELAPYGITVNAVAPGMIMAGMATQTAPELLQAQMQKIPAGRSGTVEEVVSSFLYLASEGASYITGETLNVNGGWLMD